MQDNKTNFAKFNDSIYLKKNGRERLRDVQTKAQPGKLDLSHYWISSLEPRYNKLNSSFFRVKKCAKNIIEFYELS